MRLYKVLFLVIVLLSCKRTLLSEPRFFTEFYGDTAYSGLIGFSSYLNFKAGVSFNQMDYYGFATYDWADTTGTDLPFQYRFQGLTAGLEARYRFPGDAVRFFIGYGFGLTDDVSGEDDFRTGLTGYKHFERDRHFSDIYGELTWHSRAEDAFLNLRYRPGYTLFRNETSRLWTYIPFQLLASGKGDIGTENRIETGIGLGYIMLNGKASLNLEMRAGHSFSGTIDDENYFNPVIIISVGF
ncbi:MAG: hypothetical protein N3D17_01135 [bacterium]|nr:hypothetical protein [bacterium]